MISLQNKVVLAPMAGVTDKAFREICMQNGADLCFTEMVSTKGLYYNDKKTAELLCVSDAEQPVCAQIFGHEPDIFASVAKKAASFGAVGIDINCGCPATKIISNGDGGAILKTPELIYDIVCAVRQGCELPVSVKIRKGWDDNSVCAVVAAKEAQRAGASHITVHGRTVKQGYSGKSDMDIIKEVAKSVDIPVIGNGDINSPDDAVAMMSKTGCHSVMIGRGALGNPFLLNRIATRLKYGEDLPMPTDAQRIDMALKHIKKIVEYKGEYVGIREARKHAIWYIKGMRGSVKIKNLLTSATSYDEMRLLLTSLIDAWNYIH